MRPLEKRGAGPHADAVTIANSVVAANVAAESGPDLNKRAPSAVDLRYSLIGDSAGSSLTEAPVGTPDANGNLIGGPVGGSIDPLLAPLTDNGGIALTHALLPGSPAENRDVGLVL